MSDAPQTAEAPVVYNEKVIRLFSIATIFWGVVAFLSGVYIAL